MRRLLAAFAALLLLVVGAVVLLAYVRGADTRALAGVRTVDVLVADELIPKGTSGDALKGMVRTELVPAKTAVAGRVVDLDALTGLVATVDVLPGEQLRHPARARHRRGAGGPAGGQHPARAAARGGRAAGRR